MLCVILLVRPSGIFGDMRDAQFRQACESGRRGHYQIMNAMVGPGSRSLSLWRGRPQSWRSARLEALDVDLAIIGGGFRAFQPRARR
jgi:hypothetical protein